MSIRTNNKCINIYTHIYMCVHICMYKYYVKRVMYIIRGPLRKSRQVIQVEFVHRLYMNSGLAHGAGQTSPKLPFLARGTSSGPLL